MRVGAYRIERRLGTGGMGAVYLAIVEAAVEGLSVGDEVAVKVVHPHLLVQPGFKLRVEREAEIGLRVQHENVVRTYDVGTAQFEGDATTYLVMEHVSGETLRSVIDREGRLDEERCRSIGRDVAHALGAIHAAGVVHRDLKPENLLITKEGVVKVMDLGVARLIEEKIRLSQTGSFLGSLQYAAPEQFESGRVTIDHRADLYALGVVLWEAASGDHPYYTENFRMLLHRVLSKVPRPLSEVAPDVTPEFEAIVNKLLEKRAENRYADAAALAAVL